MPAAAVLAPAGFIIANLIIYYSGFETVWKLGIVLVIGYILIGIFMAFDRQRPPLDWKSAQWLPVYLIGLGILSWQGQFGPNNTNRIPFGWDMLIVAAFALVIFYWAQAVRLPREEMLNLINRQAEQGPADAVGH
jgi:ABC-type dipeptide/oligopeptide/nickel transport system permease component